MATVFLLFLNCESDDAAGTHNRLIYFSNRKAGIGGGGGEMVYRNKRDDHCHYCGFLSVPVGSELRNNH